MTYTPARPPGINAAWPILGLILMTGLTGAAWLDLIPGLEGPHPSCIIDPDYFDRPSTSPRADRQSGSADYLEYHNQYAEAEALREEALDQYIHVYGLDFRKTIRANYALGNNFYMQGKYALAWAPLMSAYYAAERTPLAKRDEHLQEVTCRTLSIVQLELNNLDAAELMAQHSYNLAVKNHPHHCLVLARAQNCLANVYFAQGRFTKAAALFDQCLPLMVEFDDDIISSTFCNAADCQTLLKHYARAGQLLDEAHKKHNPNCRDYTLHEVWIQEHRDFLKLKMGEDSAPSHALPRKKGTA
ncbi:MAG: tetratricopeptide repeat protein [Cyanobacteria bacterium SZAS TMP-1]|nr:tetratricopeptide repeat protein [Cyanobacteria bacterium SZAS TMP-1]